MLTDCYVVIHLEEKERDNLPCSIYLTTAVGKSSCLPPPLNWVSVCGTTWEVKAQKQMKIREAQQPSPLKYLARGAPDTLLDVPPNCFRCRTIISPSWQVSIICNSSLLKVVFCDRERLFMLALLLHAATLYMPYQISVISQMTGACLNKFYRGQELVDEGARSSGSIW